MYKNTTARGGTELQLDAWRTHVPPALQELIHLSVSAVSGPQRPLKPHIFWAHQAADQPSVQNLHDPLVQQGIDVYVFVSEWQKSQYIKKFGIALDRCYVLRNAIDPIPAHSKPETPLKLIYTSTPFRGLDVLLNAFAQLPPGLDVELHIYSGMSLYGRQEQDVQYAALYDQAKRLPCVQYHGVVTNEKVREALQKSHIFAYPCTWEETSCISLIEAIGAGCLSLVPDLAALSETSAGYAQTYKYVTDKSKHAQSYCRLLVDAIESYSLFDSTKQVSYFNQFYSWERRAQEWASLIEEVYKTHKILQ